MRSVNFLGLSLDKLLPIALLAIAVLGPAKLPLYAAKLRDGIRAVRNYAKGAKEKMRDEMGPEFDDVDWKRLDPRQYDPRRIVRDALTDDPAPAAATAVAASAATAQQVRPKISRTDAPAPFDTEAT
ncbi:Twin-arginine translocation protein TatB [Agrococcus casei LMG 22410]|uniref:Twin-arginine translocation protein TatB n=1 Tax=Agrococcus casei LMG 22410 TaxID=1255656 RepID=A0A1R4FX39_9MICO|nr:Twin-arginine translocation protein TatB [Agrococcus casei LMG 22410]